MRKILYSALLTGFLFTSCNLHEEPFGQLNIDDAITSVANAEKFREGLYTGLRGRTAGAYISYTAIQGDEFIGVSNNGNRLGVISLGNINPGTTDLEGAWANPYSSIMQVNYYLPRLEEIIKDETISEENHIELIRYRGEAKWTRAYNYWYLVDHYCQAYTLIDPTAAATGLPLVTEFDPTGDYGKYPGRSTLEETFKLIEDDLKDAYADLSAYEESLSPNAYSAAISPEACYLNTYVVLALQARIALMKGDWKTAISKAEEVIENPLYALAPKNNYGAMWTNDKGTELIFVPYGNGDQKVYVPSTGGAWIQSNVNLADYVASANALAMYDEEDDVRYEWFFEPRELDVEGSSVWAPAFVKFPGNQALNTVQNTNALRNLPKPFRLSEIYLILAEAAAASGDATKANDALNEIRNNRIYDYTEQNYQGTELRDEIRLERSRELIGEGFRISDLRRWNLGFSRSDAYNDEEGYYDETASILLPAGVNVSYVSGDHRLVWPIPTSEMEANPQLAGQQNPGYGGN